MTVKFQENQRFGIVFSTAWILLNLEQSHSYMILEAHNGSGVSCDPRWRGACDCTGRERRIVCFTPLLGGSLSVAALSWEQLFHHPIVEATPAFASASSVRHSIAVHCRQLD